ncbi:MAG TPA: hypothetical protein VGK59_10895 [Ohtaekwangia sp.]
MNYEGSIDIGSVLNHFDDTVNERTSEVNEYFIRFITNDGKLRTMRARKGVRSPKQGLRKPHQPKGKFRYNLKRNGTMLVFDLDLNEYRTVKVAHIFGFRTKQHPSWNRVFH